jgi:antitoxin component of RelBE/YafQ-DinJ toxin-antitoxin module
MSQELPLELFTKEAKLISATSEEGFNNEVNKHLKDGWTIHGHMIIVQNTSVGMFKILMVKVDNDLKEMANYMMKALRDQLR